MVYTPSDYLNRWFLPQYKPHITSLFCVYYYTIQHNFLTPSQNMMDTIGDLYDSRMKSFWSRNSTTYFQRLKRFLNHEYASKTIFPKGEMWPLLNTPIRWSQWDVGQDLIHFALTHAYLFVRKGVPIRRASNIYKELETWCRVYTSQHGDLTKWQSKSLLLKHTHGFCRTTMAHAKRGWKIHKKSFNGQWSSSPKCFSLVDTPQS